VDIICFNVTNAHTSAIIFIETRAFLFDGLLQNSDPMMGFPMMLEVSYQQFRDVINSPGLETVVCYTKDCL
jgi:hypothetical protein